MAEEVILPKTQPGSTVQMDYAQGTITIVTPLNPNYLQVGKRNRQGRVQAEVYYFAGREPDGLKPVNIVPKADNVSMTMVRFVALAGHVIPAYHLVDAQNKEN
ncbi:MAG: hypothetical protein HQM12_11925 [SAR324 cluster bacterium]|nr:hypothetical protein [SAR324 cluster bacterium]